MKSTQLFTQKEAKKQLYPQTSRHSPAIILHKCLTTFTNSSSLHRSSETPSNATHSAFEGGTEESNTTTYITPRAQSGLTSVKKLLTLNPISHKRCRQESYMLPKICFNSLQLCPSSCILCQKSIQYGTDKHIL